MKRVNFLSSLVTIIVLIFMILWDRYRGFDYSPGDHPVLGLMGAVFLVLSVMYTFIKRTSVARGSKGFWADLHILFGLVGVVFVLFHSAGIFLSFYGLLTVSIIILFLFGINIRFVATYFAQHRFGAATRVFLEQAPSDNEELETLIKAKEAFVRRLNANASEGTFSLGLCHWLVSPSAAVGYLILSKWEKDVVRRRAGLDGWSGVAVNRYIRLAHIALAALVVVWFLIHALSCCEYFRSLIGQ